MSRHSSLGPICDYCGKPAEKVGGDKVYPHRPDLYSKIFWSCLPCGAYVGCHPGRDVPLGRLADAKLRRAKQLAHAALDPIWKSGKMKRRVAYERLAKCLGLTEDECHIGEFDVTMCKRVVEEVRKWNV